MPYTSRVFAVLERLTVLLSEEVTWPAHPVTGNVPAIFFGGPDGENLPAEVVTIVAVPSDNPTAEWVGTSGVGVDELFGLKVVIDSLVPSLDTSSLPVWADRRALTRMWELADVVQTALRNQSTGQPAGGFLRTENGCQCLVWRVSQVVPEFYLTEEGVGGHCEIDVLFMARI